MKTENQVDPNKTRAFSTKPNMPNNNFVSEFVDSKKETYSKSSHTSSIVRVYRRKNSEAEKK